MLQPPPTMDCAYNILLQDERQRQVSSPSQFRHYSSAFNTHFSNKSSPITKFPPTAGYPKQFNQRLNFDLNRANLVCRYCKKPGHLIDKCYKLHGFPSDFKFTKGVPSDSKFTKGRRSAAHVELQGSPNSAGNQNSNANAQGVSESDSLIPGLTKDQYSQLMLLLQQTQLSESMASANFAGNFSPTTHLKNVSYGACMLTKISDCIWI